MDGNLWRVRRVRSTPQGRVADLVRQAPQPAGEETDSRTASRTVDDLIVVAEFGDPVYPGLVSTGRVERGGDKPFHTVINAENYHALQLLLYTHEGKVDAIYIDPPYNSGARDWKYNNDYVDKDDAYRHSKWLAMMERRLKLARRPLNPESSVLIVAIDENEVHRLGLLLEQTFAGSSVQMITSVVAGSGRVRQGQFSLVEEHFFLLTIGQTRIRPWDRNMLDALQGDQGEAIPVEWKGLRRRNRANRRGTRPNQLYPIFVRTESPTIHSIGDPLPNEIDRHSVEAPAGTEAVWPLKPDGTEMLWGLTPQTLRRNFGKGFARVGKKGTIQYLETGTIAEIENGSIAVAGRETDGSVWTTTSSTTLAPSCCGSLTTRLSTSRRDFGSRTLPIG